MKKLYAFSSLLIALLTGYVSQAQLAVNSTDITAVLLAQSLVGDGVTVVSATLVCPDGASGIFSNGNTTNLGIQDGILLTSGSAQGAVGPNDLGSFSASNGGAGDVDLNALVAPFTTNDACYLEITFVPAGELIVFNYVFGSEEYNEYVCSNFNDIFAFFVTGPGYDNENIALIPGTLRPVTINNVNNGTPGGFAVSGNCDDVNFLFSDFFVDNFEGNTIQYDGFTTQLTANLQVVPDQEYTIKLAIADVTDALFDSGVFIESESFISVDVVCDAGELFFEQYSTDELEFCLSDVPMGVTINNNSAGDNDNYVYLVTDEDLNILEILNTNLLNLETWTPGTYLIWGFSFGGNAVGLQVGENAADIEATICQALSNSLTVVINECGCNANGGEISTQSPTTAFCKSDDEEDIFVIDLEGAVGENMTYVVTWANGEIFLISDNNTFNLSGIPGNGVCLFWHLSWNGEIFGAEIGANAFEIEGDCFDLSNPIEVQEWFANGGTISTEDETTFCVGDGEDDIVNVNLSNTNGANGQQTAWVITDGDLNILDLPAGPPFNFEGAAPGACIIWHLGWVGELNGAEVGANAADLSGDCFQLSNPITVTRIDCNPCPVDGGEISTQSPTTAFCKSDGEDDIFVIDLEGAVGDNMTYLVTWANGEIFMITEENTFDLEGIPGNGICIFWHLSWNGEISGLAIGQNAFELEGDCFDLSNPIEVQEWFANGGTISTEDETTFCVGDGEDDIVNVNLSNTNGANGQQTAWVITDGDLNILDLPAGPPFNFEGAGPGACIIWHLGWVGELNGAEVGANAADLSGDCFQLSNPITVTRIDCEGSVDGCFGVEVLEYVQGTKLNGSPLDADRTDPSEALGEPDRVNAPGGFVSLGYGGSISIRFDGAVLNLPGDDIQVWETSFASDNCLSDGIESAHIELSQDGFTWIPAGTLCRDGAVDIAVTGLSYITAIKIINDAASSTFDGYDVDGVEAINGCIPVPEPIEECFGSEVISYLPGPQNDGTPITDPNRIDPTKALGQPELDNTFNFVSLGYGGELIIGFPGAVLNGAGPDILVAETTLGNNDFSTYPESADVYVTQNGFNYFLIGSLTTSQVGLFDIDAAAQGFTYITAVKVVDTTPIGSISDDGFDVDAVVAINGCIPIPEIVTGNCYATEVLQYVQGTRSNGGALPVTRTDETRALGEPERTDANVFVTLGYGGSLVVAFDGSIPNQAGDDIEVVETSFNNPGCASYPEYADVYLSQNGVNFYFAKTICKGNGFVDIDDAGQGFAFVNFVKLVNNDTQTTTPDGFDVDGIVAIHNCTEDDSEGDGIVLLPASATIGVLSSSPNPAVGESVVVFRTAQSGPATLEVFDMSGRNMETLLNQVVEANQEYTLRFNTSGHANGIYVYRLSSADNVIIEKFMISR